MSKQKMAEIKKLHQKKYREETGLFILEGWKLVEEALNAGIELKSVLYDEQKVSDPKLLTRLQKSALEIIPVKSKEMESISDTVTTQGIIAVAVIQSSSESISALQKKDAVLIVALDAINDPGNLGTIIRTCDWFGVDALVIGKNSVEVYNPKVVRSTMGSLFHLPIQSDVDLAEFLTQSRKEGFSMYSTELSQSDDVRNISFAKKSVIVIGSESHGVSSEISRLADKKVFIPKFGQAESLNAAMACGIILSHIKLGQT